MACEHAALASEEPTVQPVGHLLASQSCAEGLVAALQGP